jgi:hypothetical protein
MKKVGFSATIRKEGINPYVDPPLGTAAALAKKKGVVPVKVWLDPDENPGLRPFRANLMPLGAKRTKAEPGEHHRLYLHGVMRKAVGKDTGHRIQVILEWDRKSRTEPMNRALGKAFRKGHKAMEVFGSLSPSHRKEINRYLNQLKSQEALQRNLAKVLDYLTNPEATWFGKKKSY